MKLLEKINELKFKIKIKMETIQNKRVYIYTAVEMEARLLETLKLSFTRVLDRNVNSRKNNAIFTRWKKFEKGEYTESLHYFGSLGISQLPTLVKSFIEVFSFSSKKTKKKINKLLYILSRNLDNQRSLIKLMNIFRKKGDNMSYFVIVNSEENRIAEKRKEYKTIVKYIKMDLQAELKRTREEYKSAKGDFYK